MEWHSNKRAPQTKKHRASYLCYHILSDISRKLDQTDYLLIGFEWLHLNELFAYEVVFRIATESKMSTVFLQRH